MAALQRLTRTMELRRKAALAVVAALCLSTTTVLAAGFRASGTYDGRIDAVAPGFWAHVGVDLEGDQSCNGKYAAILFTDNPRFDEIYAVLLTAASTGSEVSLYRLSNFVRVPTTTTTEGYCEIKEASLGRWPGW